MEEFKELNFIDVFLPLAAVVFLIALGVVLLNRNFQKNLALQRSKNEALQRKHQLELLKSSIDAQEAMRKRIAQDLHDELGATLSIARMQLVKTENDVPVEDAALKVAIANVRSLTENALTSMRKISHQLMPPMLERYGLLKTLESVQEQINRTEGLHVQIDSSTELPAMPWEVTVSIYRITMELIQNTVKHAQAKEIRIHLECKDGHYNLTYVDDGIGLRPDEGRGLGLMSLEARANALGGTFEVRQGQGFRCLVSIPTKNTTK